MDGRKLHVLECLMGFYGVFFSVSLSLVGLATWQILAVLSGQPSFLHLSGGIVLLLAGAGLVLEFYVGFKVDLKELKQ